MKTRGVGRPKAIVKIPNRRFTFEDLQTANSTLTPLTLRKFLKRDAARNGKSEIVLTKDKVAPADGIGRHLFVYIPRAKMVAMKAKAKATKVASDVAVVLGETPAPVVPVAEVAPVAETVTAETPATEGVPA